ncbi:unnamed protein product [Lactuca virosa]|uniref:Uncharacterized protein n=1 Tax=Lactuca virosa TaxID=75947 RepID=A0AAU9NYW5_9ASTR|nr:unnamed protein product [Lactuca virosa]
MIHRWELKLALHRSCNFSNTRNLVPVELQLLAICRFPATTTQTAFTNDWNQGTDRTIRCIPNTTAPLPLATLSPPSTEGPPKNPTPTFPLPATKHKRRAHCCDLQHTIRLQPNHLQPVLASNAVEAPPTTVFTTGDIVNQSRR